jgi:gamma-polyglutamate synthase
MTILFGAEFLGALSLGLVSAAAAEVALHQRRLRSIPNRIHVSGTRGKSSVTRLIASALREAGRVTTAKTTGTLARAILPDGSEHPIFRPAGANIMEQTRVVAVAAAAKSEFLVLECMALQPELHWIAESKFVRATHGVITNARADHLDVMGPLEEDVAKCLAGMIPVRGKLFTRERRHLKILEDAAKDRGTQLIAVSDEDVELVKEEDLAGFLYTEHPENIALSLAVLKDFGIERDVALAGMRKAAPDPGALTAHELDFFGRQITFVNAFAANDPESTAKIWEIAKSKYPNVERRVVIFNLRADRASRTVQLAQDTQFWHEADAVVLVGAGSYLFARMAGRKGMSAMRFVYADSSRVEEVFETVVEVCGRSALAVGVGNIGGLGLDITRYFRNRSKLGDAA